MRHTDEKDYIWVHRGSGWVEESEGRPALKLPANYTTIRNQPLTLSFATRTIPISQTEHSTANILSSYAKSLLVRQVKALLNDI